MKKIIGFIVFIYLWAGAQCYCSSSYSCPGYGDSSTMKYCCTGGFCCSSDDTNYTNYTIYYNIGAIIGGCVGGFFFIGFCIAFCVICCRINKRQRTATTYVTTSRVNPQEVPSPYTTQPNPPGYNQAVFPQQQNMQYATAGIYVKSTGQV